MLKREMTLGEEIINLTKNGIDVPTVERMYRKYIAITNETEEHCRVFKNALLYSCKFKFLALQSRGDKVATINYK